MKTVLDILVIVIVQHSSADMSVDTDTSVILDMASYATDITNIPETAVAVTSVRIVIPGVFDYAIKTGATDMRDLTLRTCRAIEGLNKVYRYYYPENILLCGFDFDGTRATTVIEVIGEDAPASSHGDRTVTALLEMGLAEVKKAMIKK